MASLVCLCVAAIVRPESYYFWLVCVVCATGFQLCELNAYIPNSYLHATGESSVVNIIAAGEVLTKSGLIVLLLPVFPEVEIYLAIMFVVSLGKLLLLGHLIQRRKAVFGVPPLKIHKGCLPEVFALVRKSYHASKESVSVFLLYQLSLPLTALIAGPSISGYVALLFQNVRNYLLQLLFSSIHPLLVPLGAKHRMAELSEEKVKTLLNLLQVYAVLTSFFCFSTALFSEELLSLWLGNQFSDLVVPFQVFLLSFGIALGSYPKIFIVIANDKIKKLSSITFPASIIVLFAFLSTLWMQVDWMYSVFWVAAYSLFVVAFSVEKIFLELLSDKFRSVHSRVVIIRGGWVFLLVALVYLNSQFASLLIKILTWLFTLIMTYLVLLGKKEILMALRVNATGKRRS
jgi:hypothetical protein